MIAERFAPEKLLELGSALLFISFHMGVSENEGYLILGSFKGSLIKGIYKGSMKGLGFGVSEKLGVPYFGVLIIRILLFTGWGTIVPKIPQVNLIGSFRVLDK